MEKKELYCAIRRIAYGYLILHIDFSVGTINILPNWAGYLLFLISLEIIGQEIESAKLLKPLGKLLMIAEVCFWLNDCFGEGALQMYLFSLIARIIGLYFHFQLLTNLAEIAEKYEFTQKKAILNLRTVYTLLVTGLHFMVTLARDEQPTMIIISVFISLLIVIAICLILFAFSNAVLETRKKNNGEVTS